jgi:hypothetical protein
MYKLIYQWLYSPFIGSGRFFSCVIIYTVGKTPWTGISQSQGHYLRTEQHKHKIKTQTSISRVRFETTTQVFERTKTVHALDRAVTVIGHKDIWGNECKGPRSGCYIPSEGVPLWPGAYLNALATWNSCAFAENRTSIIYAVNHYTDWATPAPVSDINRKFSLSGAVL